MDEEVPRRGKTRAWLLLSVIFVLGLICGGALFFLGQRSVAGRFHPPPPRGNPPMARLSHDLRLDKRQEQRIREVLIRQRGEFEAFMKESRRQIIEVLDPDQARDFERLYPPRPAEGPWARPPGPGPGRGPGSGPRRPPPRRGPGPPP